MNTSESRGQFRAAAACWRDRRVCDDRIRTARINVRPVMTRRFFVYAFALVAALLAVAGLIQLGTMWYSPSGLPVILAARPSAGPLAQMSRQRAAAVGTS